jgi:hypothetical protein
MRAKIELYRKVPGFEREVWKDLIRMGEITEGTVEWNDAYAVARETMTRARANVERIISFLREHDYLFGYDPKPYSDTAPPWVPPAADVNEKLKWLRALIGPVPLSLRAWWEIVGFVSLYGTFAPGESDPLPLTDPLMFSSLEGVLFAIADLYERERLPPNEVGPDGRLGLPIQICPDAYTKSKYSGGIGYELWLPDGRADAPLRNVPVLLPSPPLAIPRPPRVYLEETFVSYLRRSFQWAGFPGIPYWCPSMTRRLEPLFGEMLPI